MIIVDFSQVCLANLMVMYKDLHGEDGALSRDKFRRMVLATIRLNLSKFKKEYGPEVVIACDSRLGSWRKDYFPYYKANRKKGRDESTLDWKWIFESIDVLKAELREYFPYRVIEVEKAEADDVVGVLAHHYGVQLGDGKQKLMIVSGDKDFAQLQKFSNVYQYSPVLKRAIKTDNPDRFLREHIVRGDGGDGVPNALSADDTYVREGGRNVVLTEKRFKAIMAEVEDGTHVSTGYSRNRMMIDLSMVPDRVRINIMEAYEAEAGKSRQKLMTYFIKNRLGELFQSLQDF